MTRTRRITRHIAAAVLAAAALLSAGAALAGPAGASTCQTMYRNGPCS